MHYTIWCDESIKKGKYFSNFYGGVIVPSKYKDDLISVIEAKKNELNFYGEVKWTKVTANYVEKYIRLIDLFFDFVKERKVKVRIMFTNSHIEKPDLTNEQIENEFFILYYQFIKHAFGLLHPPVNEQIKISLFFDNLPDNKVKCNKFKDFIFGLNSVYPTNVSINREEISEVDSKKHVLLQCLDIVLGAMAFRLNKLHLEKIPGKRVRGKKTIAKEQLYKHIYERIRDIMEYPFNIGCSTGINNNPALHWAHPYSHWLFKPKMEGNQK